MALPFDLPHAPLRIQVIPFAPRKGAVAENAERMRARVRAAAEAGVDLVVFPESALSGYYLEGGVAECALGAEEVASLLAPPPAEAPDVVLGFYERWEQTLYNSAIWLTPRDGRWAVVHVHRKLFPPTYGVFDEARFVESGQDVASFDTRFGRVGLLVCEDAWHALAPTIVALDGAELLVVVSASPAREFLPDGAGRPANLGRWEAIGPIMAQEHGFFVAVAQLFGTEGGKIFAGGGMIVGPDGSILARGDLFSDAPVEAALDGLEVGRARARSPMLSDLRSMLPHLTREMERAGRREAPRVTWGVRGSDAPLAGGGRGAAGAVGGPQPGDASALELDLAGVERALVAFLRDEIVSRRGFGRVVLGLSGGVDSAVSLLLAVRALGPDNVFAFRLPYTTSSPESLEHARLLVEQTGVQERTIDIGGAVDAYVGAHEPGLSPLRRGNLAARFRAMVLFDQSAALNALPLGTGNKSERLLGYFTWHADDSPPVNPLGDLFKTQVWALARHLGVPQEIVGKPASADLVAGVHDEDELGISYAAADPILHALLLGYTPGRLIARGFNPGEVQLVWRRLNTTHWKRERPTVAMVSGTSIGNFYLRPVDY